MQEQRDKLPEFIQMALRAKSSRINSKAKMNGNIPRMAGMTRDPLCGVHSNNNNSFSGLGNFWERKLKFTIYEVTTG